MSAASTVCTTCSVPLAYDPKQQGYEGVDETGPHRWFCDGGLTTLHTPETPVEHRIRWFGRVTPCDEYPDGYVPRTKRMRGGDWGWDVRCSCGWETRTGGAIEASVKRDVDDHRMLSAA